MAPKRKAAKDKTERQPFVPYAFERGMGAALEWFYYDESGEMRRWDAHADALSAAAKADTRAREAVPPSTLAPASFASRLPAPAQRAMLVVVPKTRS